MYAHTSEASSMELMPLFGKPLWKSLPEHLTDHESIPEVPQQGWESAESTQYTGPFFTSSSLPSLTTASTPTPFSPPSSPAMKSTTMDRLSVGLDFPSSAKSLVTRATCPRQSVV